MPPLTGYDERHPRSRHGDVTGRFPFVRCKGSFAPQLQGAHCASARRRRAAPTRPRPIIPAKPHFKPADLRAVSRLAVDATLGVVGIVEQMHHTIGRLAPPLGQSSHRPTTGLTGLVYRSIRAAARASGGALELLLRPLESLLRGRGHEDLGGSAERQAVVAALNGVIGDRLAATASPLAVPMTLLHQGRPLRIERAALAQAIPAAQPRVLLLVHGLCMHPGQWAWGAEMDSTLLHVHYNTGRRVGTNGRELAQLLEALLAAWPVPSARIDIVGHSMGGLVARSACHYAGTQAHRWPSVLERMVFLGTPHHGSPLERGGHIVDVALGASPYTAAFARIGRQRSAGITDLRQGSLLDEDAPGAPPQHVALPAGVACHAVAGVMAAKGQHWKGRLLGDGLVSVDSALGVHKDPARSLAFGAGACWTAHGVGHLALLHDAAVRERVHGWLQDQNRSPGGK
jgi:hypothetical protein